MDAFRTWLAFLSADIIQRCTTRLHLECPGCRDGLLSPLLHYHTHFSLHDTMKKYMDTVVLEIDLQQLFNEFLIKFGLFDLPNDEFVKLGQNFVRFSTPDAIYYGNYINKENDAALYVQPTYEPTPIKPKSRKKKLISQNDVSGQGTSN